MIDALDHAAQERGNRSAGAWLLVALLGIVLSVAAGMMSYGYMTAQAEQRFADVVDYVATQSLSYDAFNSAYTTKNLIRVMEIAGEAARDMERDGSVDSAMLEQYADQFNVSALIVTDASGNLVSESSTGDVGYESLATYLKESPVLEVATHPLKSYTARITLADDSVADIGCVTRQDGEGIVIAVRHQSAKAVASNTLKLQSLLDGYETIDSGNIVIESDGKVVATNAVEPTVLGVFDLPATDVFIVDGIKDRCLAGKVRLVNADGEWYLGTFGKAHKFYVYTYASAQRYFEVAAAVAAGVLALYSGVIAVVVMVRRRADRRRLTDLLQQERDYGDKLAKAAREASSANSAKTEFLRRMSHDLRTPINGIRGMVEVGDANADDLQKQTECRSKIWTASGLLLDLANEALDMSRLESGQVDLNLVPINLVALNCEVRDILERQAEERLVFYLLCSTAVWLSEPTTLTFGDGLWFSFETVSTIGFGDIPAETPVARAITVVLSVISIFYIAMLTGVAVNYCNTLIKLRQKDTMARFMDDLEHLEELDRDELADLSRRVREYRRRQR